MSLFQSIGDEFWFLKHKRMKNCQQMILLSIPNHLTHR